MTPTLTDFIWKTINDGETWTLFATVAGSDKIPVRRKLFDVHYLGRTQVAFGDGRQRWKVTDRRYWVDNYPDDIPVFDHVYEAKDWVDTVVRLT